MAWQCDRCGQVFESREEFVVDTANERSEPNLSGRQGRQTRLIPIMLCEKCARARGNLVWFYVGAFVLFVFALWAIGRLF